MMRKGFRKGYVYLPEEEVGKAAETVVKKIEQYKLPIRKIIIFLTFLIIVAMCLYPPWLRTFTFRNFEVPLSSQYAFLFTPPEKPQPDDYRKLYYNKNLWASSASIDIRRLAVQCFIVLIAGGGLAYLWPEKKKPTEG